MEDNNIPSAPTSPIVDSNPLQPQPANPADAAMQDAGQSPINPIEPSTPENQESTNEISDFKSKVIKKQEQLKRASGKAPSYSEAQHLLIEDLKTEKEKVKTQEASQLLKKDQSALLEKAEKEARLTAYLSGKKFAEEEGIQGFEIDEEMEQFALEKDQQTTAFANEALQQQQQELEKQQQMEAAKAQQQAQVEQQAMEKEQAVATAQEQMHKKKIQATVEKQKAAEDQITKEDADLKQIDPERFWNNASTGRKVMAGIGLLLSGIGSGLTGQKNMAMETINKLIDNDIKAQKLNAEQGLAKKKMGLEQVKLNLQKLNDATSNRLKQAQIGKIVADVNNDIAKLQEKRLMAKKLSSSEGLTKEEIFGLSTEDRKLMVRLSDGKFRPATSAELAKKLNGETIPQAKDAIRGLSRLKEIMALPAAELRLSLRAEAATIKQALKGSLRLELFGPGVMTDFESKMADKIIGDPTKLLTMDSIEKAKFDALLKKVKQGTIDKIRQAGVDIPKTKNEKILDQFMSKNKSISRPEAINALIKLNYWDESADVGF